VPPRSSYRFADFVLSPRRRQVLRNGEPLPLIPRYFDLLVLLIERRPGVVTRREIFDVVWGDVIVSDGALSQAVRTLRRTLGDDPREPTFIRTVSRHGYSFVFVEVHEEDDERVAAAVAETSGPRAASAGPVADEPGRSADERLIDLASRLLAGAMPEAPPLEDRRDLAQQLHVLDTRRAVDYLVRQPAHAEALALMRDTRWDVPGAGPVPLLRHPEGLAAAWALTRIRTREALRVTKRRWAQAAGGAAGAGALAGAVGGILLVTAPTSRTPATAVVALTVLGALAGFTGAAGMAAGIVSAEAVARSRRGVAIVAGGAIGGLLVGAAVQVVARWTLSDLFGLTVRVGGGLEGLCLGCAVGVGYAATTRRRGGGIARPVGAARWRVAAVVAACGAATAMALSALGSPMVGGVIHAVAEASAGSHVQFTPLGAWLGEPAFGPLTQRLVAGFEGGLFGFGLAWGLTRRVGSPPTLGPAS
jgi:DNA-binding winged helix-turn-helix (wHTH) protein